MHEKVNHPRPLRETVMEKKHSQNKKRHKFISLCLEFFSPNFPSSSPEWEEDAFSYSSSPSPLGDGDGENLITYAFAFLVVKYKTVNATIRIAGKSNILESVD